MRLIPGKTKVQIELFRGVTIWDILVGAIALILLILIIISSLPHKLWFCIGVGFLTTLLVIRLDDKPNYILVLHMFRHLTSVRRYSKVYDDETLKKKGQNEIMSEYLNEYKEEVRHQEEEIMEDPDSEYYEDYEVYDETADAEESEYDEYDDYEELDDEYLDSIHYNDNPDDTEDLDRFSTNKKKDKKKDKKKKGLYTISFGKKNTDESVQVNQSEEPIEEQFEEYPEEYPEETLMVAEEGFTLENSNEDDGTVTLEETKFTVPEKKKKEKKEKPVKEKKNKKEAAKKEADKKESGKKSGKKLSPTVEVPDDAFSAEGAYAEENVENPSDDNASDGPSYKELLEIDKQLRKEEEKILKSRKSTEEEKDAVWLARANRSAELKRAKERAKNEYRENRPTEFMDQIIAFTNIKDGYIEYGGKYFGVALEIDPVEFRFFSQHRRDNSIEAGLGRVLRGVHSGYSANIVKIERPVIYDNYLTKEEDKLVELRKAFESGIMTEEEFKGRVQIVQDRIEELRDYCFDHKVITPFYYIVLFESDKKQLDVQVKAAIDNLTAGEMRVKRLDTKELAVFLKYTNQIDFDEREIDQIAPEDYAQWAYPQSLTFKFRTIEVNNIVTHNLRVVNYPTLVGDAWLAGVMSMPATKVVVKCTPMDRGAAVRSIDRALQELRGQHSATGVDSKRLELETHIESLSELLGTLQGEGEELLSCNIFVTAYDIQTTKNTPSIVNQPTSILPVINQLKKNVRRSWQEQGFRLNNLEFEQIQGFIGQQISAYDPFVKEGRGVPSNSIAAAFPWIYAHVSDEGGFKLGTSDGVPIFVNFFRRDSERVNSNMVVIGKSGSGKSYATKSLLSNLAAEDAKIYILDPENEYSELAGNLNGKVINVANAQHGRLNPFHIITALDDDDSEGEGGTVTGSFATHLQFLEEFYRQILPEIDKDALEYLNTLTERLYTNKGITQETNLSRLTPDDYPIFDDLYDEVLSEFERTDNEYIRSLLRSLVNYVSKFASGGRNANIWNGPSTVTTDENFTVFNFQSMLSNRNTTIANAQMLLVLKYIDNEIIKNRDYNTKYKLNRKIVVVIDEAHVFIDEKYPVALDFMFQLAKRIRKYNGMQIVITQNIKDFVGSEEIARKSTAIINACQYSFIFALAPNDIQDLCRLYEKAGGINEMEQEQITQAPRGQAFTVLSPQSRSIFRIEVPKEMVEMFQEKDYQSPLYSGAEGEERWNEFVGDSRMLNIENTQLNGLDLEGLDEFDKQYKSERRRVVFEEIAEEEAPEILDFSKRSGKNVVLEEIPDPNYSSGKGVSFEEIAEPAAFGVTAAATAKVAAQEFDYQKFAKDLRKQILSEVREELASQRSVGKPYTSAQSLSDEDSEYTPKSAALDNDEFDFGMDDMINPSSLPDDYDEDEDSELLSENFNYGIDSDTDMLTDLDTDSDIDLNLGAALDSDTLDDDEEDDGLPDDFDFNFDDLFNDIDEDSSEDGLGADLDSDSGDNDDFDFSLLFSGDEDVDKELEGESGSGDVDILSLLMEEAENYKTETRIKDISDIVGEGEVVEISMEELAALVKFQREARLNQQE